MNRDKSAPYADTPLLQRRHMFLGLGAASLVAAQAGSATSVMAHHKTFRLPKRFRPQTVRFTGYRKGRIIVDQKRHYLYLTLGNGKARRYGVGLGKLGRAMYGTTTIRRKAEWPRWTPTKNMIRREPKKYARFAKGVPGGPGNPLGSRALYLYRGRRDTFYRIHGTTNPWSIGASVSNGCVRMLNAHVEDLYNRVPIGTRVTVI